MFENKAVTLLLCVPLYPFAMLSEWHHSPTHSYCRRFKLRKASKEYWADVRDALMYRKGGR